MTERTRSAPFVQNDSEFLWFCLTVRSSGIPGSKRLEIRDGVLALDLDNAVALRLLQFDEKVKKNDRKLLAYEVCKMAFGSGESDEDLPDIIKSDPYADENTVVS